MEIVIIGCRSLDHVGGIESYMLELSTCLVRAGHNVKLYVGSDRNTVEFKNGIQIINIKVPSNKYINKLCIGYRSTKSALKNFPRADIFHYNANVAGFFSFIPILKHKNVVFQGHGFEWRRTKWSPVVRFFNKLLDSFVLKINHNILMCSQEQIEYVQNRFKNKNLMFAPGGIHYPPYILNEDIYSCYKNKYILFLGRIVPEKRLDLLLQSFENIKDKIEQDLVIVGPIEKKSIVQKYVGRARVHFLGSRKGDEKLSLIKNAVVYVLPSDLEGLSIALLETMSYGILCLVSNIEANKEALGDSGVYFEAGNVNDLSEKLYDICSHQNKYKKYCGLAEQRVKTYFEWNIISNKIIDYYNKIINK
jgi:glycosyltransferase involved in cell wall biosynthesis